MPISTVSRLYTADRPAASGVPQPKPGPTVHGRHRSDPRRHPDTIQRRVTQQPAARPPKHDPSTRTTSGASPSGSPRQATCTSPLRSATPESDWRLPPTSESPATRLGNCSVNKRRSVTPWPGWPDRPADRLLLLAIYEAAVIAAQQAPQAAEPGVVVLADNLPQALRDVTDEAVIVPTEGTSFFPSLTVATAVTAVQQGIVTTLASPHPDQLEPRWPPPNSHGRNSSRCTIRYHEPVRM